MLVQQPPRWPAFGAVATKLRYDAPISVCADDGTYSSTSFEQAWDPSLQDVVVALPNGSRFVFWRGSSYVPFWTGQHNTGLSYEWAETSPPADGFADCVEPLMDKELRYGRVTIVESTPARVHVRWSYQSCDFQYKVWGDSAVEDYYFYPDGFGTRVLTLQSEPSGRLRVERIHHPDTAGDVSVDVLPPNLVDVLFLDGQKRELDFPFLPAEQGEKAQVARHGGHLSRAAAQGRTAGRDLLQSARLENAGRDLRTVLRPRASWSRRPTGAAIGRWPAVTPPAGPSTTGSTSRPATTVS